MRASPNPFSLVPLVAGLALGACGGGLYDAKGVPALDGGGLTCSTGQIVCGVACTGEDATHCGSGCEDCTAQKWPQGGRAACLREGTSVACGYECTDGRLKCAAGCCGVLAIAAGHRHTCALLANGEIACWGANEAGQVGDGSTAQRLSPRRVGLGSAASAVAAGAAHSCAVAAGAVLCWGANGDGQVRGAASAVPEPSPVATPVTSGAVSVAAGAGHTCALLASGAVLCWGANGAGQLGPGPGEPVASGATSIALGRDHSCALVGAQVRCWGSNAFGQLGAAPSGGIAVPIASGIQHLAAGGDQTCAATGTSGVTSPDDALRCWGDSLGAGWLLEVPQPTPAVPRRAPDRATVEFDVGSLACGGLHVCVGNRDEAVECLGANERGQLGGTLEPGRTALVRLPGTPAPGAVTALAAGAAHSCAVAAGAVLCWGANDAGQLGDGTTVDTGGGVPVIPLGR